jgi:sugar/nucleoside kinase (ribokinase family)
MGILAVGSVALDSVKTPFGQEEEVLGGSATYFSIAASYFTDVSVVAVVGEDFPPQHVAFLQKLGVDTAGLERKPGKTFRWQGEYGFDLNTARTLDTQLNVFADFAPKLHTEQRMLEFLFLGNIDPDLQRNVLEQVERPRLIACDTMNYWIERKNKELIETLGLINVLILNDSEARLLSHEPNLIRAARVIRGMGPGVVIIKKGEHGALLCTESLVFSAPAYPMENIFDPTGAGDSFAGGFVGWLARTDDTSEENLKRAVIYGSTLASFCVEKFGVEGLQGLTYLQIQDRFREFRELSRFDED